MSKPTLAQARALIDGALTAERQHGFKPMGVDKDMADFFGTIASATAQHFNPQTGAVLITDAAGTVLGAARASSGTGDEDEQIVVAAITAAGLQHI